MDQNVAERHDPGKLGNRCGNGWINAAEADEGFTDDFKLSFHRRPQHVVGLVAGEIAVGGEARDALAGAERVP